MSQQIRGNTQIISGTILNAQIASAAGITNDKLATFVQAQNAGGFQITNAADPTTAQALATRNYIDLAIATVNTSISSVASGLSWKDAVKTVYTTNVATLTGLISNDGYTPVAGDRVLLTAQTTGSQNNIYIVGTGAWTVAPDATNGPGLQNATVTVENGTVGTGRTYTQTVAAAITVGTTSLTWVQGPSITPLTFRNGLVQSGLNVDVVAGDSSLTSIAGSVKVNVDNVTLATGATLAIKAAGVGPTQLAAIAGGGLAGGAGSALTVRKKVDTTASGITGAVNSSNAAFTLSVAPSPASIEDIYLNGLILQATVDYTISGTAVTMIVVPQTGDLMIAKYPY